MTASIKRREDKLCDREDYVEDQKLSAKTKREQLNQQGNTGSEENEIEGPKDRLKRTKTVSYFTTGTH